MSWTVACPVCGGELRLYVEELGAGLTADHIAKSCTCPLSPGQLMAARRKAIGEGFPCEHPLDERSASVELGFAFCTACGAEVDHY